MNKYSKHLFIKYEVYQRTSLFVDGVWLRALGSQTRPYYYYYYYHYDHYYIYIYI